MPPETAQPPDLNLLKLYRAHREEILALADPTALFALGFVNQIGPTTRAELQNDLGVDPARLEQIVSKLNRAELLATQGENLSITPLGKQVLGEVGIVGSGGGTTLRRPRKPSNGSSGGGGLARFIAVLIGIAIVGVAILNFSDIETFVRGVIAPQPTSSPTSVAANTIPAPTILPEDTDTPEEVPTETATPTPTIAPLVIPKVGSNPFAVAINPNGKTIYVGDRAGILHTVDVATHKVNDVTKVGFPISWLVSSPEGDRLYASGTNGTVFGIETNTFKVVAKASLDTQGASEKPMVISADGNFLYVSDQSEKSKTISVRETKQLGQVARFGDALMPGLPAVNSLNTTLYVPNFIDNLLTVYTLTPGTKLSAKLSDRRSFKGGPTAAILDRDGSRLYLTFAQLPEIELVGSQKLDTQDRISVGTGIFTAALSGDGQRLVATGFSANAVYVIDTGSNELIATVAVGKDPRGVAISRDGKTAYVANSGDGSLSIITLP